MANDRANNGGGKASDFNLPYQIGADAYRVRYATNVDYNPGIVQNSGADWFGPLNPLAPVAPTDVTGRRMDYPSGYNIEITPRPYEPVKFSDLRALADNYDLLRLIIETRKDQMEKLQWKIQPRIGVDGKPLCEHGNPAIAEMRTIFERPDGDHCWGTWLRGLLEDLFVIDAPALYARQTRGGKLLGLDQLDGATIKRVIDDWGRTPDPPAPAYQQCLHGFPAVNYTANQLIYFPRNYRVHKFYGFSQTEQVLTTVNIALRRQIFQLQYYTEGNMPEALIGTPALWTPKQISEFQVAFDTLMQGNTGARRRVKFVPGDVGKSYVATKGDQLTGQMDEWLARVVCFAFSISPQPFVSQMNRATAETAHEAALQEGLAPVQNWVKRLVDYVIRKFWPAYGEKVEFVWADDTEVDQDALATRASSLAENGIIRINEARDMIGKEPVPEGNKLMVKTATGYVPVGEDAVEDTTAEGAPSVPGKTSTQQPTNPVVPTKETGGATEKAAGTFRKSKKGYWSSHNPHDQPHKGSCAGREKTDGGSCSDSR